MVRQLESADQSIVSDDAAKIDRVEDYCPYNQDSSSMQEDDSSPIVEDAISVAGTSSLSLPSRLLCPRRTFLAAIILASKISQ